MSLWAALLPPHAPPAMRRDATVAVVGFTSWAAVAWKIGTMQDGEAASMLETALALGAGVLCLWPLVLGLAAPGAYARWRELLIPAHLAAQHWIGLRFSMPLESHHRMPLQTTPVWVRGLLPVFVASFCQPWLYLAFGACLLRTRLRTFLWTQPLLLAPMLWTGGSHCASQLGTTPEAATHLRRIAAAMQRGSSWLPVGPLLGSLRSGGAAAATAPSSPQAACLAVHLWLVLVLSFCLPAIVIHRLEGQEEEEGEEDARKRLQHGGGGTAGAPRQLLHQQPPPLLHSAAELLLAGYAAWLFVQVVLMLTGQ